MFKLLAIIFINLLMTINIVQAQDIEPGLTDPTRPAVVESRTSVISEDVNIKSSYKVSQIFISQKSKTAIINDQKVKVGDTIDGADVLSIRSGQVYLLVDGENTTISITPSVKQFKNE
ncbi:MAG: hypothetical protein GY694_11935 [Gammaproteobacteria bacterium]|nr:hypothetical protein [Gammaproteobacteria bacterium]